jgi:iron-siderophore transport system permease protein
VTTLALRTPRDRVSMRVPRRATVVCAGLLVATFAVAVVGIATGDFPLPLSDVLATIVGQGDPASSFIVETLRAPRVLTGLLVGVAFGIAGAIFQSVSRNPLGSPDIVGFTTGSTTGALIVILALGESSGPVGLGAVAGGVVAAVAVYVLSIRNGVQGYRLVLVGIGVAAVLQSINAYLITRATREDAFAAAHWYVGSLNARGWEHVWPIAVALVVIVPVALAYARPLALLEMGDDAAKALGIRVESARAIVIFAAVGLTAVGTASAGPIAFVALAAPQVARRLTRSAAPGLLAAGLMGALMLSASDVIAQRLLDADLPVGVVTGALGGVYLGWLLFTGRSRA